VRPHLLIFIRSWFYSSVFAWVHIQNLAIYLKNRTQNLCPITESHIIDQKTKPEYKATVYFSLNVFATKFCYVLCSDFYNFWGQVCNARF
jgi:hypothetical protein